MEISVKCCRHGPFDAAGCAHTTPAHPGRNNACGNKSVHWTIACRFHGLNVNLIGWHLEVKLVSIENPKDLEEIEKCRDDICHDISARGIPQTIKELFWLVVTPAFLPRLLVQEEEQVDNENENLHHQEILNLPIDTV